MGRFIAGFCILGVTGLVAVALGGVVLIIFGTFLYAIAQSF